VPGADGGPGEPGLHDGLDAGLIVGLLADDDRRLAVAALVLGAATLDDVCATTGLDAAAAGRALGRLAASGLVVHGDDGGLFLVHEAFRRAARAARTRPVSDEHADEPPERVKVLQAFVREGRLVSIPSSRTKRLVVLDWLVQTFEPGRRYSEAMVNLVLGQRHPDTAALRRYLVDEGYLGREAGEYWRTGGTVPT
jgi:hypothetical protein